MHDDALCAVSWCVALRKRDANGVVVSLYCAVHAAQPEGFRSNTPSVAKQSIQDFYREQKRAKDRQNPDQPLKRK